MGLRTGTADTTQMKLREAHISSSARQSENIYSTIVCFGRYVGHFLKSGGLPEICRNPEGLKAEQKVSTL